MYYNDSETTSLTILLIDYDSWTNIFINLLYCLKNQISSNKYS